MLTINMITCDICGFETDNKKVYANHRRWKHIVNRDSIEYKNFVDKCRPSTKPRITKDCICDICGKTFQLTLRESEWRKKKTYCRLITQNENERKHTKCEITLEQLLKEISIWDKKYGAVAEKVMH